MMRTSSSVRAVLTVTCAAVAAVTGCGDDTVAGPDGAPAAIMVVPDSLLLEYGVEAAVRAIVLSVEGDTLFPEIRWSVADSNILELKHVGPDRSRVRSIGLGATDVRAAVDTLEASATVIVEPIQFTAVDAGGHNYRGHSCGVSVTGRAFCWGTNYEGQLGIGTMDPLSEPGMNRPVAVHGPTDFNAIVSGGEHACAVTRDHEVFCWGANSSGQLGDGTELRKTAPVRVETDIEFRTITAGYNHTCGLDLDGRPYCWGLDEFGQLGGGGGRDLCAARYICSKTPAPVAGELNLVAISAGSAHTCGLTAQGEAYCWGYNYEGRLGDSTTTSSSEPVAVAGGHEFAVVGASSFHSCAIATDGAAFCWGGNHVGQLGNGTATASTVPVAVTGGLLFDTLAVSEVAIHTCAITPAGAVYCWGVGTCGQLGFGDPFSSCTTQGATDGFQAWAAPVPAAAGEMFTVTAGNAHTCGLGADGTAWCWGRGSAGQLGNGSYESTASPVRVMGQSPTDP